MNAESGIGGRRWQRLGLGLIAVAAVTVAACAVMSPRTAAGAPIWKGPAGDCLKPHANANCLAMKSTPGGTVRSTGTESVFSPTGWAPCALGSGYVCPTIVLPPTPPTLNGSGVDSASATNGHTGIFVSAPAGSLLSAGTYTDGTLVVTPPKGLPVACGAGSSFTVTRLEASPAGVVTLIAGLFNCNVVNNAGIQQVAGSFSFTNVA